MYARVSAMWSRHWTAYALPLSPQAARLAGLHLRNGNIHLDSEDEDDADDGESRHQCVFGTEEPLRTSAMTSAELATHLPALIRRHQQVAYSRLLQTNRNPTGIRIAGGATTYNERKAFLFKVCVVCACNPVSVQCLYMLTSPAYAIVCVCVDVRHPNCTLLDSPQAIDLAGLIIDRGQICMEGTDQAVQTYLLLRIQSSLILCASPLHCTVSAG
jgi:hypothetical protein